MLGSESEVVMRQAAVAYVEENGRLLCVWNKRYGGWMLPGGMVEEGETPLDAMLRELREETGLIASSYEFTPRHIFTNESVGVPDRSSIVHVFIVRGTFGKAREIEEGCPVTWLSREEYLRWTPFRMYYEKAFEEIPPQTGTLKPV